MIYPNFPTRGDEAETFVLVCYQNNLLCRPNILVSVWEFMHLYCSLGNRVEWITYHILDELQLVPKNINVRLIVWYLLIPALSTIYYANFWALTYTRRRPEHEDVSAKVLGQKRQHLKSLSKNGQSWPHYSLHLSYLIDTRPRLNALAKIRFQQQVKLITEIPKLPLWCHNAMESQMVLFSGQNIIAYHTFSNDP